MKKHTAGWMVVTLALVSGMLAGTAQAASGTWDTDSAGDWTDITKWLGDADYAQGEDSTATFGNFIAGDRIITLNAPITIGNITASDTTHNYTISGANILTLDHTPTAPTINVTTSGRTLTISSQISGSDGLQKSGAGILKLSNTSNNYTGGTVLNAGTISFGANNDSYLGATSGGLTFIGGQISYTDDFALNRAVTVNANWALNNRIVVNGVLSGNSSISQSGSDGATFSNTGNTFTGTITSSYAMSFASLGDSSNPITVGPSGWNWTGINKTFDLRPFTMNGSAIINSSGTGALIIQQNLAHSGASARTLTLGGSNTTSINQFAGSITNGTGSTVSLTKGSGNNIWALSGTSTYTGATTLSYGDDNGILIFQGMQALSPSTSLNQNQPGSNTRAGTTRFLDDSATPASRSGVNLNFSNTEGVGTGDLRHWMRALVGNNSTANGGTSSSTQTGSTIQLGNLSITEGATASTGGGLWLTGANGYKLQIANVSVTLQGATTGNHQATLKADAPMTVTGTVRQANDAGAGSTTTLQLEGTAAGSLISGTILNSAGGRLMNVTKTGTGEWKLSGDNTYSGVTTVSGGVLVLNHATALPGGIGASGGTSALTFSGGVLGLGIGDFSRDLGTAGTVTTVNFTGAGGWAAYDADRLVNLNNDGHQIVWATANTGFNSQILILGASTATHKVTLQNGLDLGTATRTVQVDNGSATEDAELSGVIAGGAGGALTKTGAGALLLSALNNTYSGVTTISAGTVAVAKMDNGGSPSSIGQSSNADTSLVINNSGILRYVGSGDSTDRRFRFGTNGAGSITLDASGSVAVNFTNTGSPTFNGSQTRTLNLIGSNTGNNTLAALLPSAGSTLSVFKDGVGTWSLTGANTYAGITTVNAGTLQIGAGGASGALPTGSTISIASGATLAFNRSDSITQGTHFSTAAITGAGGISQVGSGATVLNAANSYTGPTTISAGVMSATTLADGGANSPIGASANAAANLVLNGGALRYTGGAVSTDRAFTLGTAGGTIEASGSGALTLASATAPTLSGTDTPRTLTLGGTSTHSNELAAAVGDNGTGATSLTKSGVGKWVLTGDHGFTGNTTIGDGTLQLGSSGTSGSLDPDSDISVASGAVLAVNRSDTVTQGTDFATAAISGDGGFTQAGSGTTVLIAANSFTGPTTISAGELRVNGSLAAGSAVAVNGGSLRGSGTVAGTVTVGAAGSVAPGTASIDTLTVGNLNVSAMANGGSGKLVFRLDTHPGCDKVDVTGTLTIGSGLLGLEDFTFTNAGGLQAGTYTLITSGAPIIGSLAGTTTGFVGIFPVELQIVGNDIVLVVTAASAAPVVASVTSSKVNGTYTVGEEIDIEVTFNMDVVVTGSPYLTMETGAPDRNATYQGLSGTDTLVFRYTVDTGDTSTDLDYAGTGALNLNLGTIRDSGDTENADLTLVAPGSLGSISFGKAIVIDTAAPTVDVVSATTADDTYMGGEVIAITVTFDEPVWVASGTPSLALNSGGSAAYVSGSGTATLTFEYTVQAGNTAADLDYSNDSALALNSATIRDIAGNNAVLTLATPGAPGSLGDSKNIVIDTTAPTLVSIVDDNGGGAIDLGDVITFTITFNEAIDAASVGSSDFDNAGTALFTVGTINTVSPTEFEVPVTAFKAGSLTLRIKDDAVITDLVGNALAVPVSDDTPITVTLTTLTWDDNSGVAGAQDGPDAWLGANKWWNGSGNVNWSSGAAAIFGAGSAGGAVTLASPTSVDSITFNSFSGTYTLGTAGQAITLYDGITQNAGAGAVTFSSPITLGGAQTWFNNSSGTLTLSGAVNNGGNLLTIDGSGATTVGTVTLSGGGGLTKNGAGLLNFNGATLSFTGPTTLSGGTTRFGGNCPVANNLTLNGGVFEEYWTATFSRTLGSGAGQVQILGGASGWSENGATGMNVILNNSAAFEAVWGSAFFAPATLVLQAATAQNGSGLTFQNKIDLNGATRTVAVNASTTASATMSGIIRDATGGTSGILKSGPGRLILSGANTFTGGVTMNSGTVQVSTSASALGNGGLVTFTGTSTLDLRVSPTIGALSSASGYGTITLGAAGSQTLTVSQTSDTTFSGLLQNGIGTLSLTKTGTGSLTLSRVNTYSGATTVSSGTLKGVVGGSCASSGVTVSPAAGTASLGVSVTNNTLNWTCASLTTSGAGTPGLVFDFTVAPGATAPLIVTGAAAFTTTPSVTIAGSAILIPGRYPLMTWGSTSGTPPSARPVFVNTDYKGTLEVDGTTLYVNIELIGGGSTFRFR